MKSLIDRYVVIQTIIGAAILITTRNFRVHLPLSLVIIGLAMMQGGAIIFILTIRQLGTAMTPVITPVAHAHLVTTGVYHWVRHPLYFGIILLFLGWSLAWGALLSGLLTGVLMLFLLIKATAEEKLLSAKYPEYLQYKLQVPDRLIPYIL